MTGEKSKKSGEIGEAISKALLELIGWSPLIHGFDVKCNTPYHLTARNTQRTSHGEDHVFLYDSPFHDGRTDFVHISVKNRTSKYPEVGTLRSMFKKYISDLNETIECAKHSQEIYRIGEDFAAKKDRYHVGLLVWLHNDQKDVEKSILSDLAPSRLDINSDLSFYVIDNNRATFLLKAICDIKRRSPSECYEFFYPQIGTSITVDEMRTGSAIPLEIIASDIMPVVINKDGQKELIIYANESFNGESYKNLIAYGLSFASGLVTKIKIGMPDYNAASDEEEAKRSRLAFNHRKEDIQPFSYNLSILNLLNGEQ